MDGSNNRISPLVASQLPQFVRDDHETFVTFMEAYYEYLEQANTTLNLGKTTERQKNLLNYFDIDNTLEGFADKLYNEFLRFLPKDTQASREIIIKHAKDFYRAKGTEKALKFILRIIYDSQDIEMYYPKRDILRTSDGNWYVQQSLRVNMVKIDGNTAPSLNELTNFVSRTITGNTSSSTAIVERVDRFTESGTQIDELVITSIDGTYDSGEQISATYTDANNISRTITAVVYGGIVTNISIDHVGQGYSVGDRLIFTGEGTGANAIIGSVTTGTMEGLSVVTRGAGFMANNNLLITGGGGTGANAYISAINDDETYHPNTYNIFVTQISVEANTPIGNSVYSNINSSNANVSYADALDSFVYGPTGPVSNITIRTSGTGYSSTPSIDAIANTRIDALGILGRMEIRDGGTGYTIGDIIEFTSTYGYGANGAVTNVDGSGVITAVGFTANNGFVVGGYGYKQSSLPTTNVATTTGDGNANVEVVAVLGDGDTYAVSTGNIGSIRSITILSGGTGYANAPSINISTSGGSNGNVYATVIAGVYTYPGRYLDDDGHLSSYNFLQDADYYQNFSYVVKLNKSLAKYKQTLKEITHPAGMKLFGEYLTKDETPATTQLSSAKAVTRIRYNPATWAYDNVANIISITKVAHGVSNSENVYLEYQDGHTSTNIANGIYLVSNVPNANVIYTSHTQNDANVSGNVLLGVIL